MKLSFLSRLENALSSAIDGGLARVDGGAIHPMEIARRLQNEMTEGRLLGMDVPYVPNRFIVRLGDRDLSHMGDVVDEVARQIARHLELYADEEGWAYGGGVTVQIEGGGRDGRLAIEHTLDEQAPGAQLQVVAGQAGHESFVVYAHAVIGRDPDCEIVLAEPAVSRRHAEIQWSYRGYLLRDLGSSNGTFLNTTEVEEAFLLDGDLIEVGLVQMRFRRPD
ncbi:MAG: DUF3662 and FHA domain-containing protein [candidate division WS1 bacterium]|jgi:hypothetical protein|nr:DUF3662 and FHA domain-containing protein [candidate division WS1 bacterium]